MATAPSPVPVRITAASSSGISISWSAPYNGGSAITAYTVDYVQCDPNTRNFISNWQFQDLPASQTSHSIAAANGYPSGYVYKVNVTAKNAIGFSDTIYPGVGYAQGEPYMRGPNSYNQSYVETVAVSEAGSPIPTPPSAFGVATRADQGIDFIYAQLTSQAGRPDPDTQNVDPYLVTTSDQPITRLALGTADVPATVTDSEQLAGEISTGNLASAKAVVAHTTGASSFTLTKTWTSDRAAQIYTMAVLNNLPIAYATGGQLYQDTGSIRRTLIWTYDIPTPIGVGPGDTFTTTITIAF